MDADTRREVSASRGIARTITVTRIRRDSDTSRRFSSPRVGHVAIFAFVFFIAPRFLHPAEAAPPAYTVKIVDNIPAGDLGTHLPRINRHTTKESKAEAPKPEESKIKTEPPKSELALNEDKNALITNAKATDVATPTPTPEPTVESTPEPTVEPAPTASSKCSKLRTNQHRADARADCASDETRDAKAHARKGAHSTQVRHRRSQRSRRRRASRSGWRS